MKKIKSSFKGWERTAEEIKVMLSDVDLPLNDGQRKSLGALAKNLPSNGMIIADEVGLGKTRIAVALANAVIKSGGRVAVLIPPGLGYQWRDEFRKMKMQDPGEPLRSLTGYINKSTEAFWFNDDVVILSHRFSNYRIKQNAHWRFGLVPELYANCREGRYPRNYYIRKKFIITAIQRTQLQEICKLIANAIPKSRAEPARALVAKFNERLKWNDRFFNHREYEKNGEYREKLENAIKLGLGVFDLVIIDEAHKSQGEDSMLNNLLENYILGSANHRVLGLTATPVQMEESDWVKTLSRIGCDDETLGPIISNYKKGVDTIRKIWQDGNEEKITEFGTTAKQFKKALEKFVIRRDKRDDKDVQLFVEKAGTKINYRRETEIEIDPTSAKFSNSWKKAICAAEALSFCRDGEADDITKRMRLNFSNGHGLAVFMDEATNVIPEDKVTKRHTVKPDRNDDENNCHAKEVERKAYWEGLITKCFKSRSMPLYNHPVLLKVVDCIEHEFLDNNEAGKVLIFGKFTRPMTALAELLNARQLIKRVTEGQHWPQTVIGKKEENVVLVALAQLNLHQKWTIDKLNKELKKGENKLSRQRRDFKNRFLENIKMHIPEKGIIHEAIKSPLLNKDEELLNNISRACFEKLYGPDGTDGIEESLDVFHSFTELIADIYDNDTFDEDDEEESFAGTHLLNQLNFLLQEEFSTQTGKFARLLNGQVKHTSRRHIQSSFNREKSFPFVLIAQSTVGREGLNLHKYCKTVFMLHPEWNPGVAEQQVGRVDRLDSLWARQVQQMNGSDQLPFIEYRPVVFKHTYDQEHWRVLRSRWDDNRAQLQGIIIPRKLGKEYSTSELELIDRINGLAPDFSP